MNKQSNGTLVKDDNSLFELINQLTEELPPRDMGGVEDNKSQQGQRMSLLAETTTKLRSKFSQEPGTS